MLGVFGWTGIQDLENVTASIHTGITGIILAGGKSSRMGQDKGLLELEGKTFVERIIDAIRPLVDSLLIVSSNEQYDQFGVRRVEDIIPEAGPLAGVYSGLFFSETDDNLIVSCDVPLITTSVLKLLTDAKDNSEVIQLESQGETLPLIAVYKKACTIPFHALLDQGERRLRTAVDQRSSKTLPVPQHQVRHVVNINTPEQLKALRDNL